MARLRDPLEHACGPVTASPPIAARGVSLARRRNRHHAIDETNARVRPERDRARDCRDRRARPCLFGRRAIQPVSAAPWIWRGAFAREGVQVAIGGFHVSGCLAMLPEMPDDLKEAQALGVSLFAGEAEGRLRRVFERRLRGSAEAALQFHERSAGHRGRADPDPDPRQHQAHRGRRHQLRRGARLSVPVLVLHDHQRAGTQKSRYRTPDDIEAIIRANIAQGIDHFFITDDNLARNKNWEPIFDRLIEMRRDRGLQAQLHHPGRHARASHSRASSRRRRRRACAGCFSGWKTSIPTASSARRRSRTASPNIARCCSHGRGSAASPTPATSSAFPTDTPESIVRDIKIIQRELPLDLLEFFCLTPLPGSEDHKRLAATRDRDGPRHEQIRSRACRDRPSQNVERRIGSAPIDSPGRPITRPSTWRPSCAAPSPPASARAR